MSVSVIIPTYRRPDLLPRAVESALHQTAPPLEILVGADGMDDPGWAYLAQYEGHPIVHPLRWPHQGVYGVLNTLIQMTKGTQVAYLADDDYWEPSFLEAVADFDPDQFSISYSDYWRLEDGHLSEGPHTSGDLTRECAVNLSAAVLSKSCLTTLLERDAFVFDDSFKSAGDWDLMARMASLKPIRHVCQRLSVYRYHAGQMSNRRTFRIILEEARIRGKVGVPFTPGELALRFRWLVGARLGFKMSDLGPYYYH